MDDETLAALLTLPDELPDTVDQALLDDIWADIVDQRDSAKYEGGTISLERGTEDPGSRGPNVSLRLIAIAAAAIMLAGLAAVSLRTGGQTNSVDAAGDVPAESWSQFRASASTGGAVLCALQWSLDIDVTLGLNGALLSAPPQPSNLLMDRDDAMRWAEGLSAGFDVIAAMGDGAVQEERLVAQRLLTGGLSNGSDAAERVDVGPAITASRQAFQAFDAWPATCPLPWFDETLLAALTKPQATRCVEHEVVALLLSGTAEEQQSVGQVLTLLGSRWVDQAPDNEFSRISALWSAGVDDASFSREFDTYRRTQPGLSSSCPIAAFR